jgi:hypothetical protein
VDTQLISDTEAAEFDGAYAAIQRGAGVTHDDMLREFGISR